MARVFGTGGLGSIVAAALMVSAGGCGVQAGWSLGELEVSSQQGQAIQADPVVYLEHRLAACRQLRSYCAVLYRQERLGGLFRQLRPVEKVLALYRAEPLSVRFVWLDEDSRYLESAYAADHNDGQQLILERHGLFGGEGNLLKVDPALAVTLGEAKYPTTDFGLVRLMEKSLDMPEAPAEQAELVRYMGVRRVDLTGQKVHLFEIRGTKQSDYPLQELMIDLETGWPAGTRLWLDPQKTRLDALYLYTKVRPHLPLSADNFTIAGPVPAEAMPEQSAHLARRLRTPHAATPALTDDEPMETSRIVD